MRRILALLVGLAMGQCHPLPADVVVVQHIAYKVWFDQDRHVPLYVRWELTPSMLTGTHFPRGRFAPDPSVAGTNLSRSYRGSGYDRGHQMPAEDAAYSKRTEMECFYYSNMDPQVPLLNRVTWEALERWCRSEVTSKQTSLVIVCGGYGFSSTIGKVSVPSYCWKAVCENGKWTAWSMPNVATVCLKPFMAYTVSMRQLDAAVGVRVENLN